MRRSVSAKSPCAGTAQRFAVCTDASSSSTESVPTSFPDSSRRCCGTETAGKVRPSLRRNTPRRARRSPPMHGLELRGEGGAQLLGDEHLGAPALHLVRLVARPFERAPVHEDDAALEVSRDEGAAGVLDGGDELPVGGLRLPSVVRLP